MFKLKLILLLLLFANVLQAQSDITISNSATSNGSWSGGTPDVFTPSANSANILYSEIESRLVTKGVTINTAGAGSQSGNVVISNAITAVPTTSSSNVFTINATGSITLNSSCALTLNPTSTANEYAGASVVFSAGTGISLSSNITTTGGSNSGGNAGVGGSITLSSTTGTISSSGTFSTGGGNAGGWETAGGVGGAVSITSPTISITNTITTTGGNSTGNNTAAANGGSVTMSGSSSISISGVITTTGGTSSGNIGGAGGAISLTSSAGSITTSATLTTSGPSTAIGGTGGNITVTANSGTATLVALVANGGNSGNWAASTYNNGGSISISASTISATSISSIGGNPNGGTAAGNGGSITLSSTNATTISSSITNSGGVDSNNGIGGNGGTVSITSTSSNVTTQGVTSSGGNAMSTGGNGGTITITANNGTATTGTLTSAGGTVSGWNATAGTGNTVTVNASVISSSTISTIGGNITNGDASHPSGNGGNVVLSATSNANVAGDITTSGGTTGSSLAGGTSGTVSITGTGGISLSGNITTTSVGTPGAVTINDGNTTVTSGGVNDGQTAGVINSGSATFTKSGNGYFKLASVNTYTGYTQISAGRLIDASAERISNLSTLRLNGGTFNSGSTTGYDETFNTLDLNANSTIALGTGSHSISFANSSGVTWAGSTLTISGWTGTAGSSGTAGKIFVGATTGTLTGGQLAKIAFTGFTGATILNTGEVVPTAVALPVELISFVATKNNNGNQLTWVTAQEVNNDYFEIQRSHDGFEFEKIAVVKGSGTKSSTTNYTYTDESSNKVLPTYYRLKQVDYDGKFDLSNIVYVNGNEGHKDFHLYPNPLEEGKTLYACLGDDDEGIVKVSLFDMSGKLLQTFLIDNVEIGGNITIENENLLLKKGMYIIEINSVHNDYKQKLEVK